MAILISDIVSTTANSGGSNVSSLTINLPSSDAGDGLLLIAYSNYSGSGIRIASNSNFFTGTGFVASESIGNASNGYLSVWQTVSNGNISKATVEPDGGGAGEFTAIALKLKGTQRVKFGGIASANAAASGVSLSSGNNVITAIHDGGLQISILGVNQTSSYVSGDEPTGYSLLATSNSTNTWVGVAAVEKPTMSNLGVISWNKSTAGNRRIRNQYLEPDVPWAGVKTTSGSESSLTVTTKQQLQSFDTFSYLAKQNQEVYEFGIRIGSTGGDGKGVEIGLYNITNGTANAILVANGSLGTLITNSYNTVSIPPVKLIANNKYAVAHRSNSVTSIATFGAYMDDGQGQAVVRESTLDGTSPLSSNWDFDDGTPVSNRRTVWASIRDKYTSNNIKMFARTMV